MDWNPQDEDKTAAWEMYVELLTRTSTQRLDEAHGDEKTAFYSTIKGLDQGTIDRH